MYTKQIIQIENVTIEELKKELLLDFNNIIANLIKQNNKEDELLTREQTAKMLKVSLVTLWDWTKKDILPAYSRV